MDDPDVQVQDLLTDPPPPATAPESPGIVAVFAAMRQPLKLLFRRFHLKPHEVEDIAQSALVILVQDWALLGNPHGYLLTTVRRLISNHLRRQAAENLVRLEEHLKDLASEDPAIGLDRRLDAQRLLARLPPSARQIAYLHYGGGLTYQEIAAALEQPEATVRQLLSRGLRRLRRDLERAAAPAAE